MRKALLTMAAFSVAAGPVLAITPAFAAGNATVTISNYSYSTPASVSPGATVTVVNKDQETHTVTADTGGFNDTAGAGSTTSFTAPSKPGRYTFHCNFHSNMHGVLVVGGSSSVSTTTSGGSSSSATGGGGSTTQMRPMPMGGVATGGGSTAGLQDEGLLAAGAASVTAGLGGLILATRRRSTRTKA
jgi:plastocyanin